MIIERLDLIAHGRFNQVSLDLSAGPRRFHIVYGANESGKSTTLRAIGDLLFGYPTQSFDAYRFQYRDLRVGGRLIEPETSTVLDCVRRKGISNTLSAKEGGTPNAAECDRMLGAMLQNITREVFQQQYGITRDDLVAGGSQIIHGAGDLGEILFSAGAGFDSLKALRSNIKENLKAIYNDRRNANSRIRELLAQWVSLKNELQAQSLPPRQYVETRDKLDLANRLVKTLTESLSAARREHASLSTMKQALPSVISRRRYLAEIQPLRSTVLLDQGFSDSRRSVNDQWIVATQRSKSLTESAGRLKQQISEIDVEDIWIDHQTAIERLVNDVSAHRQSVIFCGETQTKIAQLCDEVADLSNHLGIDDAAGDVPVHGLATAAREELMTLANQSSGVNLEVTGAQARHNQAATNLRRLESTLASGETPISRAVLEEAIRHVGNPQALVTAKSRAVNEVTSARDDANTQLDRLFGFVGTLEEAMSLAIPNAETLKAMAGEIEQTTRQFNTCRDAAGTAGKKVEAVDRRLHQTKANVAVPSNDEFDAIRLGRDTLIDSLLSCTMSNEHFGHADALQLKQQIESLDRFHELRHQHHDILLRMESDTNELIAAKELAQSANQSCDDAQAWCARLNHDWTTLWREIGVKAGPVDEMRNWFSIHLGVIAAGNELDAARRRLQSAVDDIEQANTTLRAAMITCGKKPSCMLVPAGLGSDRTLFDDEDTIGDSQDDNALSLISLHAEAFALSKALETIQQDHAKIVTQCDLAKAEVSKSESDLSTAERKRQDWQKRWGAAIVPLRSLGRVLPESISTMLERVETIGRLRREIETLRFEADRSVASQTVFQNDVFRIYRTCTGKLSTVDDDIFSIIGRLDTNVGQHTDAKKRLDLLRGNWQQTDREQECVNDELQVIQRKRTALCREAQCERFEDLESCERRSDEFRALKEKLDEVEQNLVNFAGGESLESFLTRAGAMDVHSIDEKMETLRLDIESLDASRIAAVESAAIMRGEFERMTGTETASDLRQKQQELLVKIRRDADEYGRLVIANEMLSKAIALYCQRNQGEVLSLASEYFSRLTCRQYVRLDVQPDDQDIPRLYAIESLEGKTVPAERLSCGAADALYLSLRIASLETQITSRRPVPLIMDDCLIQLDDGRASEAMAILSELSERTQIIMFTHHRHLVDLARDRLGANDYHLHELSAS